MTDAPRTTSLRPNEWQALCHGAAAQLAGLFAQEPNLDDAAYAVVVDHVARLKMFMEAWRLTCAPHAGAVERHEAREPGHVHPLSQSAVEQAAGVEFVGPRRKGGWPKGKSRKPAEPVGEQKVEVEAVQ